MSVFPAKSRFRRRHHRCYELAFRTLMVMHEAGEADGVTLVHGTVMIGGMVAGHAWLESDDEAYDAVAHEAVPIAQYVADRGATVERRYTFPEACERSCSDKSRFYGPWHETAGVLMHPSAFPPSCVNTRGT
jgi:hypothetical protein